MVDKHVLTKLLIANRGEIARRIIRTSRRLGVRTVAVYSDADAEMPFVREADQAVRIGPPAARDSYLVQGKLLAAAAETGANAIHPGYGFLSENAGFAEAVAAQGLIWVGAPPDSIRAMGLKDAAKALMLDAGVPVTPGYMGADQSLDTLSCEADRIGYPVLIKAVAGGGGKGMRKVDDPSRFADDLTSCRRESMAAFGDDRVLIEKYVLNPRHIEVQVFGDRFGDVVHLFERDCSLQRRHQKVIEEAPAPGMDASTRAAVCEAAVRAAKAVNYVGAGTIEFIADATDGLRPDRIWFMEMNTRLQVEHPVTEMITGVDLVEWQLRVADGEPLPLKQEQLKIGGWAIEARLYAENPSTGFLPSTGPLQRLRLPTRIRVDSGVEEGGEVSPHYDPMIAKLVAHAPTRRAAAAALAEAAAEVEVWPVRTNAAFLARTAANADFVAGRVDTGFIERHLDQLVPSGEPSPEVVQALARACLPPAGTEPWTALQGFRVNAEPDLRIAVEVAGAPHVATVDLNETPRSVARFGSDTVLFFKGEAWRFGPVVAEDGVDEVVSDGLITSPMPGRIAAVAVADGDRVVGGQRLLVLEAMKMEQSLVAPFAGVVSDLKVQEGGQVLEGAALLRIVKEET